MTFLKQQSRLGIASLVLGLPLFLVYFAVVMIIFVALREHLFHYGVLAHSDIGRSYSSVWPVLGNLSIPACAVNLMGLTLGAMGLSRSESRRLFAAIGVFTNAATILMTLWFGWLYFLNFIFEVG